ncbi:MAG: rod shape-determining protein MreC [Candidatus Pacebacteria bacterium]|nr:rod shape-determining protein MreC [Candidatus Paceibacterota bacterium]
MVNSFKKKKIVIFAIGILLLVFLNFFQNGVRNVFYLISQPFQKVFSETGQKTSNWLEMVLKIRDREKQNQNLLLENQSLKSEITFLKEIEKENQILRTALGFNLQQDFNLLLADVVSRDISYDFIWLNKGESHKILKDMPVITSEKVLVGKIVEVYKHFSKVLLISNKQSAFPAKTQENQVQGIIKGLGNSEVLFDLVPQQVEIQEKERIVTISLDNIFPKGILVGEIKEIKNSDLLPYQQATVQSIFNIKDLENVFVIID